MKPTKIIKGIYNQGYGLILSDEKRAKILYFDKFGNPTDEEIEYIKTYFYNYCKKNNLTHVI